MPGTAKCFSHAAFEASFQPPKFPRDALKSISTASSPLPASFGSPGAQLSNALLAAVGGNAPPPLCHTHRASSYRPPTHARAEVAEEPAASRSSWIARSAFGPIAFATMSQQELADVLAFLKK